MLNVIRDEPMPDDTDPKATNLSGARIALAGRFSSMSQREFAELVTQFGGEPVSSPGRHTRWLVVGSGGPPLTADGQPSQALQKARQLRADGYEVEIIQEDAFLEQLDLLHDDEAVRQRYTTAQLSRILDVPLDRIRLWVRLGLIEPVETLHRLNFFDFKQVTSAKVLCDLVSEGLPPTRIRESLQRVQAWMPGMESPLSQLSVIEESGRLLVRLDDGRLAEPSGQLQLDFDAAVEERALAIERAAKSSDQWFQEALECENQGDYSGAVSAYRNAIEQEAGDPILHFNLGNVLYASNQYRDAECQFRKAVELDKDYVEAWNNLGTVLADLDEYEESIQVFREALRVFPLYADAHYNLGDVYSSTGQVVRAREHWERYLQLDPKSPWAADVRLRLEQSASKPTVGAFDPDGS